jgi:hypothetical protein
MQIHGMFPDPLVTVDGARVQTAAAWPHRRVEIPHLLLGIEYGTMPDVPEIVRVRDGAWQPSGNGRRSRADRIDFTPDGRCPDVAFSVTVTPTFPSDAEVAHRQATHPGFGRDGLPVVVVVYVYAGSRPHEGILGNGYAVVNYPNDTLDPMKMGQPEPGPARASYRTLFGDHYTWGSIAAWAWGASRVLDHVLTLSEVDAKCIAISEHSRNGKAALLAGALDERFAVVNPAGSGCAGAGSYLVLGDGSEDLAALTSRERWWAWTYPEFGQWAGREPDLPLDQHFLMGLLAPRPVLRTEGADDDWANPIGTSASYLATQPIYDFLGAAGNNLVVYGEGGQDQTEGDAQNLMAVCDEALFGIVKSKSMNDIVAGAPALDRVFDWVSPVV